MARRGRLLAVAEWRLRIYDARRKATPTTRRVAAACGSSALHIYVEGRGTMDVPKGWADRPRPIATGNGRKGFLLQDARCQVQVHRHREPPTACHRRTATAYDRRTAV